MPEFVSTQVCIDGSPVFILPKLPKYWSLYCKDIAVDVKCSNGHSEFSVFIAWMADVPPEVSLLADLRVRASEFNIILS